MDSQSCRNVCTKRPVGKLFRTARSRLAIAVSASIALTPVAAAFELPRLRVPSIFGGGEPKEGQPAPPGATPDCPEVFIESGAAMLRSPPDADGANVRYQLSLGETARECVVDGDHLTIRVGLEGSAVLGALGQPDARPVEPAVLFILLDGHAHLRSAGVGGPGPGVREQHDSPGYGLTVRPPSTVITWPLRLRAASEAR